MNKRIIFLTPKDARHGFSLAGFEQHVCTAEELEPLLDGLLKEKKYGLFVIDERLVGESLESRIREMEKVPDLVFVVLPPPLKMEAKREDYAQRLLRRAIGYHVQLKL